MRVKNGAPLNRLNAPVVVTGCPKAVLSLRFHFVLCLVLFNF